MTCDPYRPSDRRKLRQLRPRFRKDGWRCGTSRSYARNSVVMSTAKRIIYGTVTPVFFGGIFAAAKLFPVSEAMATISGSAALSALVAGLFQLIRDEAAHQKAAWLQRDDQGFQVGATSHMANIVYDKHVAFCEEYVAEVQKTIDTLVREHASAESMKHADALQEIRRRHATWVTLSMSNQLMKFENAVRQLGAKAHFVEATAGVANQAERRSKAIDAMFREFEELLPELFNRQGQDGVSAASIVQRVRCMLGIDELAEVRAQLIRRTHKAMVP